MTEVEIVALLDAHDALVSACLDGTLSFDRFLMAYGDFPRNLAAVALSPIPERTAFHLQVADILSGPGVNQALDGPAMPGDFWPRVVLQRMQRLAVAHPDYRTVTFRR